MSGRHAREADLGGFPHRSRVLAILLDERQDAGCDNAMRFAEVVVDLYHGVSNFGADSLQVQWLALRCAEP